MAKTAQCKFFKWDDELDLNSGPVAGPSRSNGNTGTGHACFKCGEEGHWSSKLDFLYTKKCCDLLISSEVRE